MPKPARGPTQVVSTLNNDRRQRPRFTAEQKLRIPHEAERCTTRGDVGELLRREGIYGSHLSAWRSPRDRLGVAGLEGVPRGPKVRTEKRDKLIEQLERKNAKLENELGIAHGLIDLQRKAHEILGIALPRIEDATEDDSSRSSGSANRRSR
ncbi:MAG: transposase [Sorangiineae bacterium]|nr:transposase [Polyangiaceae bacterium]MEB2324951.1 transposase [Sorangiineae bacterium]